VQDLVLKTASLEDIDFLFNYRNKPDVVSLGLSQKTVTREEHESWFQKALARADILIFIAVVGKRRVGQVRFDMKENEASIISIYLIPEYIGMGLGSIAIKLGCNMVKKEKPNLKYVIAHVKETNVRSLRAFKSVGFNLSDNDFLKKYIESHSVALTLKI
jgi:UDP-2,4-diacetamido-2,4,6-trideoxy-beta-L-altropyranose hydrolase